MEVQASHRLIEGTILDGRYEIGPVLGEGGFGITYSGRNMNTGAKVAIKEFFCREYMGRDTTGTGRTFLIEDTAGRRFAAEKRRFLREARIIRDYEKEPGIVTVLDYFEENETAYIVMEEIDGEDLRSYVRSKGKIDAETLFAELHPLMQSLQILHRAGVVHRDISPDNIIRTKEGKMVLIDFGSAKDLSSETKSVTMTIKDGYTPPEQYRKGCEPSVALDIYSLSATIYYCLTGFVPPASIQRVLLDELEPLSSMVMIPKEISNMITAGMSLKAEDRPKDIDAMLEVIDRNYKIIPPEEKARRKRRKRIIAAAIIGVIVLGAGFGVSHVVKNIAQYRVMMQSTIVTHYKWDNDEDMQQTKDLLKERIETFAGKNHYLFTEKKDEIVVEIPTALMGEAKPELIIDTLFTHRYRNCSIFKADEQMEAEQMYSSTNESNADEELVFAPANISEMAVSSDSIPIGDTSTATIEHLTITLKNNISRDVAELLSHKGDLLIVDVNPAGVRYHAFSDGDGRTLYIVDNFASKQQQYEEMIHCACSKTDSQKIDVEDSECGDVFGVIKNNLEEKVESFHAPAFNNELIVNWEQSGGKNQCAPDEIKGEFMLLAYETIQDETSEGDEAKSITAFKNRLDTLQIPYAFGTDAYNEHRFVIKVAKDTLKQSEAMLLGKRDSFEITNGYHNTLVSLKEEQNKDITVDIQYDEDNLQKIVAQNEKYDIDHVYLYYGDMPVAFADTEELANVLGKETMLFTNLCTEGINKDKARRQLHEDFIVAIEQNELEDNYYLNLNNLEVHHADGSYKKQGNYASFDGTCYSNELDLMDRIEKEMGGEDVTVGANYAEDDLSLVFDVSNIKREQFETLAADFVNNCMKRYTFYNTDTHFDKIVFYFSNENVKDGDEDLVTSRVSLLPDVLPFIEDNADDPDSLKFTTYCYVNVYDSKRHAYQEEVSSRMEEHLIEELKGIPKLEEM